MDAGQEKRIEPSCGQQHWLRGDSLVSNTGLCLCLVGAAIFSFFLGP